MKYNSEDLEYLKGVKFSNSAKFELTNQTNYLNRDDYLLYLTKDKTIIHLGFQIIFRLLMRRSKKEFGYIKN